MIIFVNLVGSINLVNLVNPVITISVNLVNSDTFYKMQLFLFHHLLRSFPIY